jgi:hypothetical protein
VWVFLVFDFLVKPRFSQEFYEEDIVVLFIFLEKKGGSMFSQEQASDISIQEVKIQALEKKLLVLEKAVEDLQSKKKWIYLMKETLHKLVREKIS